MEWWFAFVYDLPTAYLSFLFWCVKNSSRKGKENWHKTFSKNTTHKERVSIKSTKDTNFLFDQMSRSLNSIKDLPISFVPQSPHNTEGQGSPHNSGFTALKSSFSHTYLGIQVSPSNMKTKDHTEVAVWQSR